MGRAQCHPMSEKWKGWGAISVTVLTFLVLAWWLGVVAAHLGDAPNVVGGSVTLDVFQRSKDILLVVLPLATTAVGFWLGNQGVEEAEKNAERAEEIAEDAQAEARESMRAAERANSKLAEIRERLEMMKGVARAGADRDTRGGLLLLMVESIIAEDFEDELRLRNGASSVDTPERTDIEGE